MRLPDLNTDPFMNEFDLSYFEHKNEPVMVWELDIETYPLDSSNRVSNYLVKDKFSSDFYMGDIDELFTAVYESKKIAEEYGINTYDRYIYVTFDQGWVEPGNSLRTPGWHTDGLQGDEVGEKKGGDFQVIWSDVIPTEYVKGPFDVSGIDLSKHNIFSHLGKQADDMETYRLQPNFGYVHNPYLVHRSPVVKKRTYRRFLRICITHIPVTNITMTVNPQMSYSYQTHTTSGKIPSHLR